MKIVTHQIGPHQVVLVFSHDEDADADLLTAVRTATRMFIIPSGDDPYDAAVAEAGPDVGDDPYDIAVTTRLKASPHADF